MNRRLPRFALLVVLLVSVFGLLTLGDAPGRMSLAQDQDDPCTVTFPTPEPTEPPGTPPAGGASATRASVTQTILLPAGETVTIQAGLSSLVFVDLGEVKLTVCGEDQVAAEVQSSSVVELVGAGDTKTLVKDDSVYATSMVTFYFEGVAAESRLVLLSADPSGGALCGGSSC